jgi:hypothetical protein
MAPLATRPQIICLTPVRNEAWILDRFLRAAELWADHIIIADQGSTDGSVEIARRFEKVRVVSNPNPSYDEGARQRLLLDEARRIKGRRFLIALDADEFLTPNWRQLDEWQDALSAPPGTVFSFPWVNLLPERRSAYVPAEPVPFAFVDDGSPHGGERIHSTRIPVPGSGAVRPFNELRILHLQYTDWRRMKSKQRWYQCWEVLNQSGKRPVQIYRQYHRMDAFPRHEIERVDPSWFTAYEELGIDLTPEPDTSPLWWDQEVLNWILEHGPRRFRKLDIWDVSWHEMATRRGQTVDSRILADPRGLIERGVLRWLTRTQPRTSDPRTRWMQRMLVLLGW